MAVKTSNCYYTIQAQVASQQLYRAINPGHQFRDNLSCSATSKTLASKF